jgi:plasmid stabilization system protein ParE
MARKVVWSPEAEQNFEDILSYWKDRNKSNNFGKQLNIEAIATTKFAAQNPMAGKPTSLNKFRSIKANNYRIVYAFKENILVVVSIQDLRQEHLKP